MTSHEIAYDALLAEANAPGTSVIEWLQRELPYAWQDAYLQMSRRPANIMVFTHGTFDYIYDHYSELEATGTVAPDGVSEARLVAAVGISVANLKKRGHDDGRLRGWIGPTTSFGEGW